MGDGDILNVMDFDNEDVVVISDSDDRLMPTQLVDYDPISSGFKFTVESLQNLPGNEISIYNVLAQINSYSFNIDETNLENSVGAQYQFTHEAQPVMYQKLYSNSVMVFFISKYDVKSGKTIRSYAYSILPLIHILKGRQFLICGRY